MRFNPMLMSTMNAKEKRMKMTRRCSLLVLLAVLAGCGGGGLLGLRKAPELPEAQQPARTVPIKMHAATRLNTNARGQPLALAVRLYKLRQKDAFESTPYAAFLDPRQERESLGADLVEVREIMLVPGQRYEVSEKVAREAGHLGIVALYHTPASGRWRTTVATSEAERNGLNIGLHACAMSLGGATVSTALAAVRCQ